MRCARSAVNFSSTDRDRRGRARLALRDFIKEALQFFLRGNAPLARRSQRLYAGQIAYASHWLYMTEKRIKTAQVNLRIEPAKKAAAEKAAEADHRSLTSLIEKLLTDHLRKKGYLKIGANP